MSGPAATMITTARCSCPGDVNGTAALPCTDDGDDPTGRRISIGGGRIMR